VFRVCLPTNLMLRLLKGLSEGIFEIAEIVVIDSQAFCYDCTRSRHHRLAVLYRSLRRLLPGSIGDCGSREHCRYGIVREVRLFWYDFVDVLAPQKRITYRFFFSFG